MCRRGFVSAVTALKAKVTPVLFVTQLGAVARGHAGRGTVPGLHDLAAVAGIVGLRMAEVVAGVARLLRGHRIRFYACDGGAIEYRHRHRLNPAQLRSLGCAGESLAEIVDRSLFEKRQCVVNPSAGLRAAKSAVGIARPGISPAGRRIVLLRAGMGMRRQTNLPEVVLALRAAGGYSRRSEWPATHAPGCR